MGKVKDVLIMVIFLPIILMVEDCPHCDDDKVRFWFCGTCRNWSW
ncbi:hypothetical protein ACFL2U_03170 [Patescibacteria group bacterium]